LVRKKEKQSLSQHRSIQPYIMLNRTSWPSRQHESLFLLDVGNIQAVRDFQYTQNVFNNLLYESCFMPDDYDSKGKYNNEVSTRKLKRSRKKKKYSKLYQTNFILLSFDKHLIRQEYHWSTFVHNFCPIQW
jgi:hypothetical protein